MGNKATVNPRPSDLVQREWLNRPGAQSFGGQRILDLGCGSGFLLETLKAEGASLCMGVDLIQPPGINAELLVRADLDQGDWVQTLQKKA